MQQAKLLNAPEDYTRLGVNPNEIETWEDSRRNRDTGAGNWEWWYFDSILDDGSQAVIQFFTKAGFRKINKDGDSPSITVKITLPDGKEYNKNINVKSSECTYGTEKCDVHLGKHSFVGDFKEYHIHVEPTKGIGADLILKSQSKPYRPGSAYFGFGDEGEYYTWLCAVPKGEVTGTLMIDGKLIPVHGSGYHDHQWGNRFYLPEWNHWVWARQSFADYSILTFDFVASETYGYKRFPIVFVQDKEGNIVFESKDNVVCTIPETYYDDVASGKVHPKEIHYEFASGEKKLVYTLREKEIIDTRGMKNMPAIARFIAGKMGMGTMSYTRYLADGVLQLDLGNDKIERSGELIYEFMFPGESFEGHM